MGEQRNRLSEISMVTANFGESLVFADVLQDWFKFLGGKPGEVVVIDCGSDRDTQQIYWQLFQDGIIDKLQLIHNDSPDFGKEKGYIKEYTAGAIASKPYLLTFKSDTLPFQQGHDGWLEEALDYLDRDDIFSVGGSWNLPAKHADAWPGWYFSKKCSYNFAIMKRKLFMDAAHEFANEFILSGFTGENPASITDQDRYFIEVAFERYIENHNLFTLSKVEDPNWTVFHTNTHGAQLKQARDSYLARDGIDAFLNMGFSDEFPDPAKARYYGLPPEKISLVKQMRIAFGASPLGEYWRSLKQSAGIVPEKKMT